MRRAEGLEVGYEGRRSRWLWSIVSPSNHRLAFVICDANMTTEDAKFTNSLVLRSWEACNTTPMGCEFYSACVRCQHRRRAGAWLQLPHRHNRVHLRLHNRRARASGAPMYAPLQEPRNLLGLLYH